MGLSVDCLKASLRCSRVARAELMAVLVASAESDLLWRWAKRRQCRADGRLCIEKSFPDSIGCRVTHRGLEISESLGFVAACCGEFKEPVKALGIEEESFYLIGDPNTEGSATAACFAAVGAKDT